MRPLTIVIPGRPVPKGRPRFARGKTYTPKRTRDFEEFVAWHCRAAPGMGDGPVSLEIELRSVTELRGDCDNYAKAILDGLQKGGAFEEDSQVVYLSVWKLRGTKDETVIRLSSQPGRGATAGER